MSVQELAGTNGLSKLVLSHPSGSTAEVYLHGGHVTSFVPAGGTDALFLSRAAEFGPARAVRGGIPVIFPQFGNTGPLTKHGFARVQPWRWAGRGEAPGSAVRALLHLGDTEETRSRWPHPFAAELALLLEGSSLALTLTVRNTGTAEISFTSALHTYLRVADVGEAPILGLGGVPYRDQLTGETRADPEAELRIAGEVDRVYRDAPSEVRVLDGGNRRNFRITSHGFPDLVVWNPWEHGAAALADMEDEEFRSMVCVEAARVEEPARLAPGGVWQGTQRIEVAAG